MSELAYDLNGDAFDVPDTVTGWRVKQLRARGAPELMYAPDGSPLKLPGEASLDELHDAVPVTAKYRLEPIGADGKPVENVPVAYIKVTKAPRNVANDQAPERSTSDVRVSGASGGLELAVLEAVRLNAEAMRYAAEVNATALRQNSEISMRALDKLDKMPDLMAAMATLLNVAAGTQLHALQQRELPPPQAHRNDAGGMPDGDAPDGASEDADDSDDADDTDDADEVSEDHGPASAVGVFLKAAGFDMNRFVNDVTSKGFSFIHGAASRVKLPSLGAIIAPQKAHAEAQQGGALVAHAAPPSVGVSREAVNAPAVTVAPTIAPAAATRTPPAAVPTARAVTTQEAGAPTAVAPPVRTDPTTIAPAPSSVQELLSDPNNARRFAAVRKALSAAEQTLVVQVIQAYDEQQVVAWLATLLTLRVPDAVAAVRAALARGQSAARGGDEQQPQGVEPENDGSHPRTTTSMWRTTPRVPRADAHAHVTLHARDPPVRAARTDHPLRGWSAIARRPCPTKGPFDMKASKARHRQPTHELRLRDLPESLAWILCAGEPLLALAEHTAAHDPVARAACARLRSAHHRYYCGGASGDIDASVAPRDLGFALASVLVEGAGSRIFTPMAVLLDALDEYRWLRTWSPPRDALAAYRLVVRALDAARQRARTRGAS